MDVVTGKGNVGVISRFLRASPERIRSRRMSRRTSREASRLAHCVRSLEENSISTFTFRDNPQSPPQNPHILPRTPFLNVLQIQTNLFIKLQIRSPRDLRKTGDARFYSEDAHLEVGVLLYFLRQMRTGTHKREIAFEHVPELRELIDAEPSQEFPEARHARIILHLKQRTIGAMALIHERCLERVCVVHHRSELKDGDGKCSSLTDAF